MVMVPWCMAIPANKLLNMWTERKEVEEGSALRSELCVGGDSLRQGQAAPSIFSLPFQFTCCYHLAFCDSIAESKLFHIIHTFKIS